MKQKDSLTNRAVKQKAFEDLALKIKNVRCDAVARNDDIDLNASISICCGELLESISKKLDGIEIAKRFDIEQGQILNGRGVRRGALGAVH